MKRLASLAFALAFPLLAQEPPKFGEQIDVNLVLLDAIVTDSKGNQILGLETDDFVVKENGLEQSVESVEYFTNRQNLTAREESAPFKAERIREERSFVFFFDKPQQAELFDRLVLARRGVHEFIDRHMKPGDRVAIVGHDVRLKVYSDFTSDKRQLKAAVNEVSRFGRGLMTPTKGEGPALLRADQMNRLMDDSGSVYEALEALGDALRPIRGRKNLVLFSAGIFEPGEVIRDGMLIGESTYFRPMVRALNRANVTVYAASLWNDPQVASFVHQTLSRLASETNGEYYQFAVTYGSIVKKIEQTNSGYYLISYYTRRPKGSRGWQKVELDVRDQPQFRIKGRQGYAFGE